jgi:hypothetical protein
MSLPNLKALPSMERSTLIGSQQACLAPCSGRIRILQADVGLAQTFPRLAPYSARELVGDIFCKL